MLVLHCQAPLGCSRRSSLVCRWFEFGLTLGDFLGLAPGSFVWRGGGRADGRLLVRGALRDVPGVRLAGSCARMVVVVHPFVLSCHCLCLNISLTFYLFFLLLCLSRFDFFKHIYQSFLLLFFPGVYYSGPGFLL